jgi:hypothetical protein
MIRSPAPRSPPYMGPAGSIPSEISHKFLDLRIRYGIGLRMHHAACPQPKAQPIQLILQIFPVLSCKARNGATSLTPGAMTALAGGYALGWVSIFEQLAALGGKVAALPRGRRRQLRVIRRDLGECRRIDGAHCVPHGGCGMRVFLARIVKSLELGHDIVRLLPVQPGNRLRSAVSRRPVTRLTSCHHL